MKRFIKNAKPKDSIANFMGGLSYTLNPLDTLKMISASSIFGEPAYYRDGEFSRRNMYDGIYGIHELFADYSIVSDTYSGMKTSQVMEHVIDAALTFDFHSTLAWAETLRHNYHMRLNPQVIMVRATTHPQRKEFTAKHPGEFSRLNNQVMSRGDEPAAQLAYWLYKTGSKSKIPSILKRSWAQKLSELSRYELAKYKNTGLGIIDTCRICHANSPHIDELMRTGTLTIEDDIQTWERLRTMGKSWAEIISTIKIPHMALLRNLRGIFTEIDDLETCRRLMTTLEAGVAGGRQFPFGYWSAMNAVEEAEGVHHKPIILDALERCIDIASEGQPQLLGKTMCLSDNSGSAWGSFNSEYGRVTIAEIDNLSSVITARGAEEGYVGKFGDKLIITPISKRNGVLSQTKNITRGRDSDVGGGTENGIWLFFDGAISEKQHWDNIFIYSDQQAGHGGLYGTPTQQHLYMKKGYGVSRAGTQYIDVAKLVAAYRTKVNPKVNVFCVQTAGYTNVCVPEYGYRTNIMAGWTGKELMFAKRMIDFWDTYDETTSDA